MDAAPTTCIVVPTYNEKENIEPLVQAIEDARIPGVKVLFVDDSSPDGTADEVRRLAAERAWVHLVVREGKLGLGSAHLKGFDEAAKLGAEVVVEMDSDLQHPPSKVPALVEALGEGYDVALASRKVKGGGTGDWALWRRGVSRGANLLARWVLGLGVKDPTSGFRALSRRAALALVGARLPTSGYSFQVASLYYLKRNGMKMTEVPFTFGPRRHGRSKMGAREVGRFFVSIVKLRLGA